jgi:diguanylate cyclase (GGDEF)-like protein
MNLIQAARPVAIPTVFISAQAGLDFRLAAARAGSSAFMVKPVNITDLCGRLARLTAPETSELTRVLIVDDDPPLAEYHAQILREAGMETRIVTDPLLAMDPLLEMRPDLILMDMYMPGCTGVELAKTIRQIDTFFSIPIVFLSSETDQDRQVHALVTGGDEFLTKPIKPGNLVTAVAVRAERMKILRSFMIRDGMTGLFNHTATKDFLDAACADAARTGQEVCFAMIDLDKFKLVNDTYGHAMGDRVLIALSRLLQQRLRKSDLIGRFGGEEFAVVLPDCSLAKAESILDELRASFAGVTFKAAGVTFTATFSAGVAALSMQPDAAALCQAADEALYQAKSGGRNRVVVSGPRPPDSIPGLDLAKALSGLKGNWVRLHGLMKDFAEDSRNAGPELGALLAAGDLAAAGARLHTLKGIAGMLGANRLRDAIRTVETEVNAGQTAPPSWQVFEHAMRELLDGIQALSEPKPWHAEVNHGQDRRS